MNKSMLNPFQTILSHFVDVGRMERLVVLGMIRAYNWFVLHDSHDYRPPTDCITCLLPATATELHWTFGKLFVSHNNEEWLAKDSLHFKKRVNLLLQKSYYVEEILSKNSKLQPMSYSGKHHPGSWRQQGWRRRILERIPSLVSRISFRIHIWRPCKYLKEKSLANIKVLSWTVRIVYYCSTTSL